MHILFTFDDGSTKRYEAENGRFTFRGIRGGYNNNRPIKAEILGNPNDEFIRFVKYALDINEASIYVNHELIHQI